MAEGRGLADRPVSVDVAGQGRIDFEGTGRVLLAADQDRQRAGLLHLDEGRRLVAPPAREKWRHTSLRGIIRPLLCSTPTIRGASSMSGLGLDEDAEKR